MRSMATRLKGIAQSWRGSAPGRAVDEFNGRDDGEDPRERLRSCGRPALILALVGVTVLALVVRVPLFGLAYRSPDTGQYLETAHGIWHGGFANDLRPPGFPLLLSAFELVGIEPVGGVVFLQNLVGIALAPFVLLVGLRYFSLPVGILAAVLTAASPLAISVEQLALPDYLFGVLFFIGVVALAEAALRIRRGRTDWRLLVVAGIFFGLSSLFRANGLIGFLTIPLVLLLGALDWRRGLRAAAIALLAAAAVLAPWFLHNLFKFGDPSIATENGISLYARAISWDEVPPATDSADGRLARRVYDTGDFDGFRSALETTTGVYNAFVAEGKSPAEASAAMGSLARDAIRREPGAYLDGTGEIIGLYQSVFDPRTLTSDPNLDQIATTTSYFGSLQEPGQAMPGDSGLTRVPWQIAQTINRILYLVTLGGVLALALLILGATRERLAASAFVIASLLAVVGIAMTAKWESRYMVAFAPILWLLAAATAAMLVRIVVALARRRPGASAVGAPS